MYEISVYRRVLPRPLTHQCQLTQRSDPGKGSKLDCYLLSLALAILEQRLGWRLIINISLVIKFSFTGLVNIFPNQTVRRKCQWTFLFQYARENYGKARPYKA